MGKELALNVAVYILAAPILWFLARFAGKCWVFVRERRTITLGHSIHEIVVAKERDLPDLLALYKRYFGVDAPTLAVMRIWLQRCHKSLWLVNDRGHNPLATTRLVGSFKILPITRSGVDALNIGEVSGSTLGDGHVARRSRDTIAYYVGDVVGTDRGARAAILLRLHQIFSDDYAAFPVYARPLTQNGMRVMIKLGFRRVADDGEPTIPRICRLEPRSLQGIGGQSRMALR